MRVASKPCIPRMFCTYHRGSSTNHPFAVALGLLKCQFVFLFVEIALILPRLSGADLAYVSRSTLENFYHCLTQNRSKQLASDDVANSDNFKVIEKLTKTTKYPLISLAQPQFVFLEQKGPPRSRFQHGVKWARGYHPLLGKFPHYGLQNRGFERICVSWTLQHFGLIESSILYSKVFRPVCR